MLSSYAHHDLNLRLGHKVHDHHAIIIDDFKKRFWTSLYYVITAVMISIPFTRSFSQELHENNKQNGAAPSLAADNNNVYLVYASGDTVLFCSSNNNGKDFSAPVRVTILPELSIGGGRGPQIVVARDKLSVAAADKTGDIYTFIKDKNETTWKKGNKINDVPGVAKEAFVSLGSNRSGEIYAVWLDLRNDNKNKIVGAKSMDGGKTWTKNKIIYSSPDGTVCQCCKPSVEMKNKIVAVMFRNWLNGNRDLFISTSTDGGLTFDKAKQLGNGNWKLNACPMDGGGLVINNDNTITTVWRREGDIYTCEAGQKENKIATGKQCTLAGNDNKNFIAFINDAKVYCANPDGKTIELGMGSYPRLVMTGSGTALCAWQQDTQVKYSTVNK